MTTLLSWIGVDSRTPSSIYLASDSRISWGSKSQWDTGRKLFASKTKPEIFGYCGDVIFPIQVLGQLVEQIDNGLFFSENEEFTSKLEKVRRVVDESFSGLPEEQQRSFQILYVSRDGSRMESKFFAGNISLNSEHKIVAENIPNPPESGLIVGKGSGSASLKRWYNTWIESNYKDPDGVSRTSRSVFSAFCDSLESKEDPLSGGAPQLVGLYRIGAAISFGIVHNGERYFNGLPVENATELSGVEWRNSLFERCNGESMELIKGAQKQPRPNTIIKP
ncbi:hypothetical protein JYT96_03010 [Gammaproteobacteria bacterium AH-315-C21]|nr:hypothetical protein [Gammaproteobacteria bacterium AH-315-C21]